MSRDDSMRRILRIAALFNAGGALMFFFPGSIGALVGLPDPVPLVYRALLVLFVLLFGGSYAWLAAQPVIDRPMVALAAIGKAAAFAVVVICWLAGEATGMAVVAIAGDLVFAALFARWLAATPAG